MGITKEIINTCCFTGHRPQAFPWGDDKEDPRCMKLLSALEDAINTAISDGVTHFICGNALGVDTWAAEIVLKKKKADPTITLEIALPFKGHNKSSPEVCAVQEKADLVHVVTTIPYHVRAYHERNQYMVDHSRIVIAVYDERSGKKGGTFNTIQYAQMKGREVLQIPWMDYVE